MPDDANLAIFEGIKEDTENIIADEASVVVSYEAVTITEKGIDEFQTFASGVDRTVLFYISSHEYRGLPEGFFEDSDAIILAKSSEAWTRESKITYQGITFSVTNVTEMDTPVAGNLFCKKVVLARM